MRTNLTKLDMKAIVLWSTFYKKIMEYSKFKSILKTAEISIKDFAEILNQNPRSVTNYSANGFVPPHFSVIATLIAELHAAGKDVKALLKTCDHKKDS